jgi:hypothetical protein
MKRYFVLLIAIVLFLLISCEIQTPERSQADPIPQSSISNPARGNVTPGQIEKIAMGETIYVPVYPKIYYLENQTLNLTAALSIRNTDFANPIVLTSIRYYDGDGQLVKQFLDCSQKLAPLASMELLAVKTTPTKSISTSFIVEWVAATSVNPPLIEGVMLSTISGQGISFTSLGRVIQNPKAAPVKVCQ